MQALGLADLTGGCVRSLLVLLSTEHQPSVGTLRWPLYVVDMGPPSRP